MHHAALFGEASDSKHGGALGPEEVESDAADTFSFSGSVISLRFRATDLVMIVREEDVAFLLLRGGTILQTCNTSTITYQYNLE